VSLAQLQASLLWQRHSTQRQSLQLQPMALVSLLVCWSLMLFIWCVLEEAAHCRSPDSGPCPRDKVNTPENSMGRRQDDT